MYLNKYIHEVVFFYKIHKFILIQDSSSMPLQQ